MIYFPINLLINNRRCTVIGGGNVAERKVVSLLEAGANVKVISPEITPKLKSLFESGEIDYIKRDYIYGDLKGSFLVFAATDNNLTNEKVFKESRDENILLNIVDDPERCDFIMPSIVRRGELLISISTSGNSPALSKKIREELEELFGEEYKIFLKLMGIIRKRLLKDKSKGSKERENIFKRIVYSDVLRYIKENNREEINSTLVEIAGKDYSLDKLEFKD
jgi:precorrin-2 dehydrogenase/sirohydrochlorin ferrochelatase